jgi:hypothetical protein
MARRVLLREIRIVGQYFLPDADRKFVDALPVGQRIDLSPEPTNPHDGLAVLAHVGGRKIGYIPKEMSPAVALFCEAPGYKVHAEMVSFADKGQKNPIVNVYVEHD